jgi:hypothetical protein
LAGFQLTPEAGFWPEISMSSSIITALARGFEVLGSTPTLTISNLSAVKLRLVLIGLRKAREHVFSECGRHHRPGRTHCLSQASYGGARLQAELAVVLKKSDKHFQAIIPCTAKHPLGWPQ